MNLPSYMKTTCPPLYHCNSQKTKHIDIRYNLKREQVKNKVITMEHLQTKDMTSDILTKPLAGTSFLHLRLLLLGIAKYVCKKVY